MVVLAGFSDVTPKTTTEFSKLELIYSNKILLQTNQGTIRKFQYDASQLNVNQAIPCLLIIYELITNSVEHAFSDREKGEISVLLENHGERIRLVIDDDGIGIPDTPNENNTLGLQLISVLSKQLKAEYEYHQNVNTTGTRFTLKFRKAEIKGSSSSHFI